MDGIVDGEDVGLARLGLLDGDGVVDVLAAQVADLEPQEVAATYAVVDRHDEQEQIAWLVVEHVLDCRDGFQGADGLYGDGTSLGRVIVVSGAHF